MLIKSTTMDAKQTEKTAENINIIRRIIDEFERDDNGDFVNVYDRRPQPKPSKKKNKTSRIGKISRSDSLIHKYKRSQISPATKIYENNFIKFKPTKSLQSFVETDDEVYINFIGSCDRENSNANFWRKSKNGSGNGRKSDGMLEEYKVLMSSKNHQEKVKRGVNEFPCRRSYHKSFCGVTSWHIESSNLYERCV